MESAETSRVRFALQEIVLPFAGKDFRVLHTQMPLSVAEEEEYFHSIWRQLPFGVALWPACLALTTELCNRAEDLRGKTLLELGAGLGLPGMVARHLGAEVVQTDNQEMALAVSQLNAKLNDIEGIVHWIANWKQFDDAGQYDYIIGSEILYEPDLHPYLYDIFHTNLAPNGYILITDPMRGHSMTFLHRLADEGWLVTESKWEIMAGEDRRVIGIFELRPPDAGEESDAHA